MKNQKKANNLINEKSVYLLQHAYNPVNWYPWSDNIIPKAKIENKLILVSIGYSSCHWCHVMERESFEDEQIANLMNQYFINVKVDREERSDLDGIFVEVVQSITGSAGWPLHVFLLPNGKPFFGGTYFPPIAAYNRPSWQDVLLSIHKSFINKQDELEIQANQIVQYLQQTNQFKNPINNKPQNNLFNKKELKGIVDKLLEYKDAQWGGFNPPPKFPQFFSILFLIRYHYFENDIPALNYGILTIDKIINGGIYDQLEGGISRYSTDEQWLVPHFEKMLYDNALLIIALTEIYQITKNEIYRDKIIQTIDFIENKLSDNNGGFYTALDADTDGIEGLTYTWKFEELKSILNPEEFNILQLYYQFSESGNWEHTNILWVNESVNQIADKLNKETEYVQNSIFNSAKKLLNIRNTKKQPTLDTKKIVNLNALILSALIQANKIINNKNLSIKIIKHLNYIEEYIFVNDDNAIFHSISNPQITLTGFLDDYAYLIQCYIHYHQISADINYLIKAKKLTQYVIDNFTDSESSIFLYVESGKNKLFVSKKDIYDNPTPSGNSIMVNNLFYLASVFEINDWEIRAIQMLAYCENLYLKYPSSFSNWANNFMLFNQSFIEITITGKINQSIIDSLNKKFIPNKIILYLEKNNELLPQFQNIDFSKTIYKKCQNRVCSLPFEDLEQFLAFL